jgi:hypothetical protein
MTIAARPAISQKRADSARGRSIWRLGVGEAAAGRGDIRLPRARFRLS